MSENSLDKQSNQTQGSPNSVEKKEPTRKSLLGNSNLNKDLKQALNSWDSACDKATSTQSSPAKTSPSDEKMQEVKKLLGELKSKLDEFA